MAQEQASKELLSHLRAKSPSQSATAILQWRTVWNVMTLGSRRRAQGLSVGLCRRWTTKASWTEKQEQSEKAPPASHLNWLLKKMQMQIPACITHYKPFLETEVKTVFGSAKTNRRFATDFSWQVHEVDKIISNVLGEGKNYYLLRAFFTWLIQTTFKYISFCVLHYSTSRSNSGQIWILFLSALIIDISFCNCKIPSSGGRLSHCPKILWKFFWKKKNLERMALNHTVFSADVQCSNHTYFMS